MCGLCLKTLNPNSSLNGTKKFLRFGFCICVLFTVLLAGVESQARDEIKVIAVVNGEPVTNLELTERISYLQVVSQLELAEVDLRRDAIQGLIADKLKFQFGKSLLPDRLVQLDGVARQILDQNFGRDGKSGSAVLTQLNISHRTVLNKIKADVMWANGLRQKFARQFRNISKSAEQELEKLKQLKSEPQIKFREIILLPNPNRTFDETFYLGDQIVAALNRDADFTSIAQQYSEASTASRGGLVDWAIISRLPEPIRDPLLNAQNGDVIGPINLGGQVFIFQKGDTRELGQMDPLAAIVSLARVANSIPATASAQEIDQATKMLIQRTNSIDSCADLTVLAEEISPELPPLLTDLSVGSLSAPLQDVILDLDVGEKTQPLPFREGLVVFMLCDKTIPGLELPNIEALEQAEFEKLLSTISGRFLLRLQRQASIIYKDQDI